MSYVLLPLQMQIKIRACWTLLIGHSDQQMLGRWTDLKKHSATSAWCWKIQSVAEGKHQLPNLPAMCSTSQPGLDTVSLVRKQLQTSLSLWLSQVASREEAFCTFAWTHYQTNSSLRLLSAVGDFSPLLSSLFPTVIVADCVCPNRSDDLWSSMNWWILVRQNVTELHNDKFAEHPHPLLPPSSGYF